MQESEFSAEQRAVIDAVLQEGRNVFFTGPAGSGKSKVTDYLIRELRKRYEDNDDAVVCTATTGSAAAMLGGQTIHSFAGIGHADKDISYYRHTMKISGKLRKRLCAAIVVFCDEISPLNAHALNCIDAVMRRARRRPRTPFGGCQMIITGDFFQLPPIQTRAKNTRPDSDSEEEQPEEPPLFAFESRAWRKAKFLTLQLTKVFRQNDEAFVAALNEAREGRLSAQAIATLEKAAIRMPAGSGIKPTRLYCTNANVNAENDRRLRALKGPEYTFMGETESCNMEIEKHNVKVPHVVGRWASPADAEDGFYLPPAATLKRMEESLIHASHVPRKLKLRLNAQVLLTRNLDVKTGLCNGSRGVVVKLNPLTVRFRAHRVSYGNETKDNENEEEYRDVEILPVVWTVTAGRLVLAAYKQVPLCLAWAMTIHRSQGMTLDCVRVVMNVFCPGQAYVGISRARSLDSMEIVGFDPSKVYAHERVVAWHAQQAKRGNALEKRKDITQYFSAPSKRQRV